MNRYHIVWLLIDSARNFETAEDDRGLPTSVAKFAKDAIFFKNVVCSAPSTLMSVSSIMTSTPSYLLSRSYDNFPGIADEFTSFPDILKGEGYDIFGAIYFKHGREALADLFGSLDKKYLPGDLKHRKEVWTNRDVFNVFRNISIRNDWNKPTFCYLHYNVRVDRDISKIVDDTLKQIKTIGIQNKTIIIINSDHGYPMPDRGYDRIDAKKVGWGHDMLLYNDNIMTPFVLKIPGREPREILDFGSTIDIIPTLCAALDLTYSAKFYGKDLLSKEHVHKDRLLRVDNRYLGQLPSSSAILWKQKKLIVHTDLANKRDFEMFDLSTDPLEKWDLSELAKYSVAKNELIRKYNDLEMEFLAFHEDYLLRKWEPVMANYQSVGMTVGLLVDSVPKFITLVERIFSRLLPEAIIQIIGGSEPSDFDRMDLLVCVFGSEIPWNSKKLIQKSKEVNTSVILYTDNNGALFKKRPLLQLYINYIRKRMKMFKQDKLFIFEFVKRILYKRILKPIEG